MVYSQCMVFTQKLPNLPETIHNEVKPREKNSNRLTSNEDLEVVGQGL